MTAPAPVVMKTPRLTVVPAPSTHDSAIIPFVDGTVADHVRWMRHGGLSPATVEHRRKVLRLLCNHARRPLLTLTRDDLDDWQTTLLPLALQSQRSYKVQVRGYYRWACDEAHLIDDNPALVLRLPRVRRGTPRPITEPHLELALTEAPPMIRVWLELAAYVGLRAGEIAVLERADILDDALPAAVVVHGKGGKIRVVPLPPQPLRSLNALPMPSHGRLFRMRNGQPVSPKYVSGMTNKFLHGLGLPETIHKGRHRCATQALANGLTVRQVQEILGHDSLESTAVYTFVDLLAETASTMARIDRPLLRPAQETGT